MVVAIDIDGTVANAARRFKAAGPEPRRDDKPGYMRWLRRVQNKRSLLADLPVPGMPWLCQSLASRPSTTAFYLTGREEKWREVTTQWLKKYMFPALPLVMRPDGCWLEAEAFKEQEIKARLVNKSPVIVLDDDEHGVIEQMCKRNGFTFLKARSGGQR